MADVQSGHITFTNANSRDTYFTMHNVRQAHQYSKGRGIKVGIVDRCFGLKNHPGLYAGGVDVSGNAWCLENTAEHGYWMALALAEIAPECQIYAINYLNGDNFDTRAAYIVQSIEWAMQNKIDVLTFSGHMFTSKEREIIDPAIEKAVSAGMITTFIHYDHELNFFPGGLFKYSYTKRDPDIRILHYDYNTLFVNQYEKFMATDPSNIRSGNDIPYFSISSTSPVLAGFVAILKANRPSLTLQQCKDILRETSYATHFKGCAAWEEGEIDLVADIGKAVRSLLKLDES